MQLVSWLAGSLLLLPAFAGVLCYVVPSSRLRNGFILLTSLALVGATIVAFATGALEYSPRSGIWHTLVTLADIGLLAFFAVMGWKRKSPLIIALVLLQALMLAYLKFGLKAQVDVQPLFVADWLTIAMLLVVGLVGSVVVVYSVPYMTEHDLHLSSASNQQPRFFLLLLLFLSAMNGLLLANSLYWLFFFWEVTTFCCFLLIAYDGTEECWDSAYRALWMNLLGGAGLALAMVLVYQQAHTLSVHDIVEGRANLAAASLPLAFLCLAGLTKSAQMPFHGWLLGAMVAPTPVSALLHSSTMVKAGVYLVVRFAPAFRDTYLSYVLALIGGFTFVAAAMLAISQQNAKRVLAYSTISNLGLIIACAGLNTPMALSAAVMLILFHAISKALLFMAVGVIEGGVHSRNIERMEGLFARMPFTALVTVIGIVSMLLPPFGVLIAKWAAIESSVKLPVATVMFVIGSTFTVMFWTKWVGKLLSISPGSPVVRMERLHPLYLSTLLFLAMGAVVFSLMVAEVLNRLVVPAVTQYYGSAGFASDMPVATETGWFPVLLLFIVLVLAVVLPLVFIRVRREDVAPPYLCGEQVEEVPDVRFRAARDELEEVVIGGHYFDYLFGESRHNRWMNAVAVALLLVMFGVAAL
ncbi:MAG: proton-conducting transporter membrane subunit [Armatimonadota bacterium]|nr:NADH-quinone oxidoreductase subunit L [bacterium]MDW8319937.1 proton-conducting transporter membrane subunit [Armatimonadota bacterium]